MQDVKDTHDGFTRKKVESLTLGEKLKKLRGQYRMSLSEISKATKIQVKYLEYLENGEYEKLPADVYVRGFLKGYARHFGLAEDAFLKPYEKEQNIQENLGKELNTQNRPSRPMPSFFVLTPRTLIVGIIFIIVGLTFFYLFHEFRSFVSEPELVIFEPANGSTLETSTAVIRGKTDRGADVNINGQKILVGDDGNFSESLVLHPGINTVIVAALNRFEKEKSETLTVNAHFETPTPPPEPITLFILTVSGKDKGATVNIEADGEIVFTGKLGTGDKQEVKAQKEVKISTDNGENTLVSFQGGVALPLSEGAQSLQGVLYTPQGKK